MKAKLKPMPPIATDADAERFVAAADLSSFDLDWLQADTV